MTRPFLPPLEELIPALESIWGSRDLTNGGPFHREFEDKLADYLDVPHVSLFSNATIALMVALQALRITGEVITTPFSFVATSHAMLWNGVDPVFVDIEPGSLSLDPEKVEAAITPRTTAIMPVHVYGRPSNIDGLSRIADTYGLKIVYDAAHAFGATYRGRSLADFGDLSVVSLHATKVLNTFEGGVIVSRDAATKRRIDFLKNFGFADEVTVVASGINGKMNEFQSALGLVQLKHIDDCIGRRREVASRYDNALSGIAGISRLDAVEEHTANHGYYPIFVEQEFAVARDDLYAAFRAAGVHARRYFYPLISEFPMYRGRASADLSGLSVAKRISRSVLCLPIYPELSVADQQRVIDVVRGCAQ